VLCCSAFVSLRATTVNPTELSLAMKAAAHHSWAHTSDRNARTRAAREAFEQKFLDEAGGDPVRAAHLRKAYFALLTLKSAQARRKKVPPNA
jgi:hypothetical protein